MSKITIKQATESDITVLEKILLDTVSWLNEMGQPLWGADEVKWDALSKKYQIGDFYIAFTDGTPSGCMALVDYDPFFWPDIKQGESLFIHKLAVTRVARKSGVADALMDFYKKQGMERGVKTLRLDTHALRPKLRAFYESHGFVFVEVKVFKGDRHTAFYVYNLLDSTHVENKTIETKEIIGTNEKSRICNDILRTLPNWFGVEASIVDYVEQVKQMPFYAVFDSDKPIGFVAIKIHNAFTAEVCVMGILKEYHRQGIGKKLIKHCDEYCRDNRIEFLTVKTLDESRESKSYERTRLFYQSVGFKPLEVFPLFWDKDNPCLFMAKSIKAMEVL